MPGISPKLPLHRDNIDGYGTNKTLKDSIKQNFKCLMLTIPGERIMDPDFGVGLMRYLFEPADAALKSKITKEVIDKTKKYLPFINIVNVIIQAAGESESQSSSSAVNLSVTIVYDIIPLHLKDTLQIGIN
tara:strand:+ start:280 stop:672 length:393 start_codon:yes stop_codon:yes gene_type:complete